MSFSYWIYTVVSRSGLSNVPFYGQVFATSFIVKQSSKLNHKKGRLTTVSAPDVKLQLPAFNEIVRYYYRRLFPTCPCRRTIMMVIVAVIFLVLLLFSGKTKINNLNIHPKIKLNCFYLILPCKSQINAAIFICIYVIF